MAIAFDTLPDLRAHGFDTLIDVRSPAEFAEDHIPGAINLPALSNDQRAEVGTIYKQVSPFDARRIGAALVARNVADHLDGPLKDKDGGWRPLVYCWRGGQRSGSVATILAQIGWRAETIRGGYQSYRRLVHDALYEVPLPHRLVLLDGNTGTAKTDLLHRLAARGMQVIDLEGLAGHRGSVLGATAGGQPSQKGFESGLAAALDRCDPTRVTVLEAESSKIGRILIPKEPWAAMCAAPRLTVRAPLPARAAYLAEAYADMIADPEELRARLDTLRPLRGHAVVERWLALLRAGDFTALAAALMEEHYDPSYARSRAEKDPNLIGVIEAETLDTDGRDRAADEIAARLSTL